MFTCCWGHLEEVLVGKAQLDILHHQLRPGPLCLQVEPHAFVGLDLDFQVVGLGPLQLRLAKLRIRRGLEANGDLGVAHAHALAGAQVERHAGPAPIVDHHLQRHVGFGLALRRDVGLLAVTGQLLAPLLAGTVLATHGVLQGHFCRPWADGTDHFGLFTAYRIGAERGRRLHGHHRQQLEQVIGYHVTQGAGAVIERTTGLDADGFCCGDLHMVDVVVVPERFEQAVGEAADQNVLHRFFAQIMVDAVDLPLAHHLQQASVERLGAGQVGAEGLFHHHSAKAAGRLVKQTGLPEALRHFGEEARRRGQVEDGVAVAGLFDALGNGLVSRRVEEVACLVIQALGQAGPELIVEALVAALAAFVTLAHERLQPLSEIRGAGRVVVDADDAQVTVQQAVAAEVIQRRHQQALDQVAIGAEQEQGTRGCSGNGLFGHSAFFSTWPPKPRRMAERILSP